VLLGRHIDEERRKCSGNACCLGGGGKARQLYGAKKGGEITHEGSTLTGRNKKTSPTRRKEQSTSGDS